MIRTPRTAADFARCAQIKNAVEPGVTSTDEINAPMRAVNLKLGYTKRPVAIQVRGWLKPSR